MIGRPAPSGATITFTPPGFVEDVIASNLPFATGIAFAADGHMFIALKGGGVRVWQNGTLLPAPFLDITSQVANSNDRGLLGITLHPDFPTTPYVYLLYTWNPPGFSTTAVGGRVSRLIRVTADASQGYNVAMPGSDQPQAVAGGPGHVILLGTNSTAANIGNPTNGRDTSKASCMTGLTMAGAPVENCLPSDEDSHSIGTVMFGLDGSLFVGTGDGSNYTSVDPRALRSLNLNSLAGKIMRIDPETGRGLPDNPFFDATCADCNRSKVYAMGLRNPFRFTIHPETNEPYIGDVGWTTWEEINTGKGANFGWPCYEGGAAGSPVPVESGTTTSRQMGSYATSSGTQAACNALYAQGLGAVRAPVFAYNHSGTDGTGTSGGASANGGSFYTGTVYPPQYQSALFILDYNRRWIRYLTFDAQGKATVNNFGRETASGMVQVLTGPDTNLYVVVLSGAGSQVRRIRYVGGGNTPPTAVVVATPTIGTAPLGVTFSSLGSFDPDAQALSYAWTFGDGATSSEPHPTHTYAAAGVYTATLTLTELTAPFASRAAEVVITVGNEPPLAHIAAPADGTTYRIGDALTYAGTGTSGEVPVDPSQLAWELRLHHNEHVHFNLLPPGADGTFDVIEHGDDTFYELCLTATVPPSLTDTRCVSLLPETTPITLTTDPPGLFVNYEDEGRTQASPMIVNPVIGSEQTVSVQTVQGGRTFSGWTDGEPSPSHPFIVGTTPATYTARFENRPPVAVAQANPASGVAPLAVAFTGSGSSDPELATLTHGWDFGDGTGSEAADVVHTYTVAGTYEALLTVSDQLDGTSSQAVTVTVTAPVCGNGALETGEACDGGVCCTAGCELAGAGTPCRTAAAACDVAETCTGASADCPANAAVADGTPCGDANACNGAETCQAGTCSPGAPPVCDGHATCDPASGACVPQPTGPFTIWPETAVPALSAGPDLPVELGVKFRSDVAGYVTALRFYKHPLNTGPHVANLWSGTGTLLATAVFANETPSGWQQVELAHPIALAADTVYVASYHASNGFYSIDSQYFLGLGVDSPPLHALASGQEGPNGVFAYGPAGTFPTSAYASSNYWVDVVFDLEAPAPVQLAVVTVALPAGAEGLAYAASLAASGGTPPYVWGLASGTLPPGLTLDATGAIAGTPTTAGIYEFSVQVGAGEAVATRTLSIPIEPPVQSAFPGTTTPAVIAGPDDPVELGVKLRSDVPGYVTGIRFYKDPLNTGVHVGSLWSASGTRLASATFTSETASGWQHVTFPQPVQIAANTVYVASYHAPTGHYAIATGFFGGQGVDRPPLHLPADGVAGPNGVYAYGAAGTFPSASFSASNYYVDVVFSAQSPELASIAVTPASPTLAQGATQPFVATGTYTDGSTSNLSTRVSWTSAVPAVATISASGIATAASPGTTTITATLDGVSGQASLVVSPPPALAITTTTLPTGRVGRPYMATLAATGGIPPYAWAVDGTLPDGLALDSATGVIAGTPTATGESAFTVTASAGAQTAARSLEITVTDAPLQSPIVEENALPGNPASEWDIAGAGDESIQGFATDLSVNRGETVHWKIDTDAADYRIDVYRLGYYGGMGARRIATVQPSATLPQVQPECLSEDTTGLLDCGNWSPSASWSVPDAATSGIYIAKLVREDPEDGRASHIVFVVRDDDGHSDLLFQTSDTTWQAYNMYGGNSLYFGMPAGRAYKVSYNRPFTTRNASFPGVSVSSWLLESEYPMVRWLERNGYDVSYTTGIDTDRRGAELLEHHAFLSVGHDEYWSAAQRANMEAARDAGVHLAFLTGNVGFWKTRWETSIDGTGTPHRTLVCYKETLISAKIDPLPGMWTGTWRDPRFMPHDGGRPENALTGTLFSVNGIRNDPMDVPAADGKMRFWRNTSIAQLQPGEVATLPAGVLGYEWDSDADNGARPAGLFRLSSTTVPGAPILLDNGAIYGWGPATHNLVMYRAASGALVFGAGTINWAWGLDDVHDLPGTPSDVRMQQATVNLFADMGVQPDTLQTELVPATASTDTTPPQAALTAPASGASVEVDSAVTISGTASDVGGEVGGVEVSTNDGATWHPATGRATWSYTWTPAAVGPAMLLVRAVDDSGNLGAPAPAVTVIVTGIPECGNGEIEPGEACDGGACCTSGCQFAGVDTTCRAPASACDLAETCAGTSATCPADAHAANGASCGDGNACNGDEVCQNGACMAGTPPVCSDGNACTDDACQPASGCVFTNNTAPCSDGVACTTDVCSGGTCASAPACGPGETCNPTSGACEGPAAPSHTLWPGTTAPTGMAGSDLPVELGVRFRADVDGSVTGVRFYKHALNTGTHVGNLWSSAGTLLATATFTGESLSGWQTVTFSSPVAITAGSVYVASYHAPGGFYAITPGYFATAGADSAPLHALASGDGGPNGVYAYGVTSSFPTESYASSNYWVDVVFSAGAPAPGPLAITTPALAAGVLDTPYTTSLAASGGTPPYAWTIAGGALPPGLALDAATGVLSGTPTAPGAHPVTVQVADVTTTATRDLTIVVEAPAQSLWPAATIPSGGQAGPEDPVELGMKMRSDVAGSVTGIRFYKHVLNAGPHVGNLWSSTGELLASAPFTGETASGWQEVTFATPVAIEPGRVYVVSYHCAAGFFAIAPDFFATTGVDRGGLHALRSGEAGANGVFAYGASSTFPNQSYASSNYWVDVVFTTAP